MNRCLLDDSKKAFDDQGSCLSSRLNFALTWQISNGPEFEVYERRLVSFFVETVNNCLTSCVGASVCATLVE